MEGHTNRPSPRRVKPGLARRITGAHELAAAAAAARGMAEQVRQRHE